MCTGHSLISKTCVPIVNKVHSLVIGVDEAGRGPLAGPVLSAAVAIEEVIDGVRDSKRISAGKRETLFNLIVEKAIAFGIGIASWEEIDKWNILNATLLSMKRALASFEMDYRMKFRAFPSGAIVLVDGNRKIPDIEFTQKTIVKGDALVYEISAASIIAKVTRDRIMIALSRKYPQYAFERHKGYPTHLHKILLGEFGACEVHRKTFLRGVYEEKRLW